MANVEPNINLAKPLLILKKGKYCTQPYNRYRSIYLLQEHMKNKNKLKKYLSQVTREWGNGEYLLKAYIKNCNTTFTSTYTVAQIKIEKEKPNVTLI